MATRTAEAQWDGNFRDGSGRLRVGSGAFERQPYSARSRFEEGDGTNPEELIGAAHAGCFSMALSLILQKAGHDPRQIRTDAKVHIEKVGEGFEITRIELLTEADVPGLDEAEFGQHAQAAKDTCPVSKALQAVPIELNAGLTSAAAA